ncbi:secreted protein [Candidatus Thiomargarita nelsonii]|uniref:Secreted protein n=1 Tax=Candidatus Thiomargarita nelsonii TaxID=1003181 RepID=A0A0A6NZZ0_9GAMM|nr:secreted protein [Candidatus Thiomargarita nelsonii]
MKQRHKPLHRLLIIIGVLFLSLQVFAEETSRAEQGEVVLSWEEMKKMLSEIETLKQDIKRLKDEQAKAKQKKKEPLPVTYSITESHFSGEVKGKSAQFSAKFSVQILKEGWVKIPFFQNDVGIETITINETPTNSEQQFAQFVRESQGYYLVAC